jgi:hypothetical protein
MYICTYLPTYLPKNGFSTSGIPQKMLDGNLKKWPNLKGYEKGFAVKITKMKNVEWKKRF